MFFNYECDICGENRYELLSIAFLVNEYDNKRDYTEVMCDQCGNWVLIDEQDKKMYRVVEMEETKVSFLSLWKRWWKWHNNPYRKKK